MWTSLLSSQTPTLHTRLPFYADELLTSLRLRHLTLDYHPTQINVLLTPMFCTSSWIIHPLFPIQVPIPCIRPPHLTFIGSNTPCWAIFPPCGHPPFQDTSGYLLWSSGASYHALWMHTLLCLSCWILNRFVRQEEKCRGRGKNEEEEKPILLVTHSNWTFVPPLHQNFFCQGNNNLHNDVFSVFIQQSDHSLPPGTPPSLGFRAHGLLVLLLPHWKYLCRQVTCS